MMHVYKVNTAITAGSIFSKTALAVVFFMLLSLFQFRAVAGGTDAIAIDQMTRSLVAPEAAAYQWYYNGEKLDGQTYRGLPVRASGTYQVVLTDASGQVEQQQTTIMVDATAIRKIYLIGDSTVMTYNASAYPMTGWGQVLQRFFNSQNIQIDNRAIGGRSSRSFHEEGRWATVHGLLQQGDFVFIQFGHNDRDWSKPERYTDTAAFKSYLRIYVNETRAKGASPVLVTPMNMNTWNCTSVREVFREGANDYRGAMVEVATKLNVPLIDLNIKSRDLMLSVGQVYSSRNLFMQLQPGEYPNYQNGLNDFTHFQEMGAIEMAKLVVEGIKELSTHEKVGTLVPELLPLYPVTVTSSIPNAGIITRSASYPAGVQVTVKALPKFNTKFVDWRTNDNILTTNQKYSFTMTTTPRELTAVFAMLTVEGGSVPVAGGTYRISDPATNLFMDVSGSSTSNNAEIIMNAYSDATSQQWRLRDAGDGYFNLVAVHSDKSIDIAGRTLNDGGRLLQYTSGTGTNQQFKIEQSTNGTYTLTARHSSKCMGINPASSCANLVQYGCENAGIQKFIFHNLSVTSAPNEALVNQAMIFPNPAENAFRIKAAGKFSYTVYNEVGQVLEAGEGAEEVEAGAALKRGLYFVQVKTSSTSRVIKLLKK